MQKLTQCCKSTLFQLKIFKNKKNKVGLMEYFSQLDIREKGKAKRQG